MFDASARVEGGHDRPARGIGNDQVLGSSLQLNLAEDFMRLGVQGVGGGEKGDEFRQH